MKKLLLLACTCSLFCTTHLAHAKNKNKSHKKNQAQQQTAQQDTSIALNDLEQIIPTEAQRILEQANINLNNLPTRERNEYYKILDTITVQIKRSLILKNKQSIKKSVLVQILKQELASIMNDSLSVVSIKALPRVTSDIIKQMLAAKNITPENLPPLLTKELSEKTTRLVNALIHQCKARKTDLMHINEIKQECTNVFTSFVDRAYWISMSIWGQRPMQSMPKK